MAPSQQDLEVAAPTHDERSLDMDRRTFLRITSGAIVTAGLACHAGASSAERRRGNLEFASDWRTTTGNSKRAISDGDRWDVVSSGTSRVEVIPAAGLDFPPGMRNVLAGRYRNTDSRYWIVQKTDGWNLPLIGGVMCKRLYFRHTVVGSSAITYHPVEPAVGPCAFEGEWVINSQPTSFFGFRRQATGGKRHSTRGQTYRVEERWERTGAQTWVLHMRVYDSAGTLIRQDADFNCTVGHGAAHSLASTGPAAINTTLNAECLRSQHIGWQGSGTGRAWLG